MQSEFKKYQGKEFLSLFNKYYNKNKKVLDDYINHRIARGLNSIDKQKDVLRVIVQLSLCAEKDLSKLDIKEVNQLVSLIKNSKFSEYHKNEIITDLKSYLKWGNKNIDFVRFEDIRLIKNPQRVRVITKDTLLTKEDVEKCIKHENKSYWKTFLLIQYEAGLRTKEIRMLKWKDISDLSEEIVHLNVYATKTKQSRDVFIKEAVFYLKKLREEQINLGIKTEYVFPSKRNPNIPVNQASVSNWMKDLTLKTLGRSCWNYLLRHSRGNELYQLSKENKISQEIATKFMGHSKKMSEVYTHDDQEKIKQMLKEQIYNIEDNPKQDITLKNKVEVLEKVFEKMMISQGFGETELSRAFFKFNSGLITKEQMEKELEE